MKRATETRANPRALAMLAVVSVVLAGCEEALSTDGAAVDADNSQTDTDGSIELFPDLSGSPKDSVEAPDVFLVSEAGLWDGRPSLGGIWVAHPDVTQPERVRIKNARNNKSVTGALFRRERDLPGPALQLSSAAAEELGILAGAPTEVEVVALRRKEPEPKPEPVEEKPEVEETPEAVTETAAATDAPAADATEAETAETEQPEKRKWWQKKKPAAAATGAATAAAVAADAATDTAAETATEAATEAAEVATEAAPTLVDPEVTPPAEQPAKRKWWQKKKPDEITETPLDPIAGAAAAIEASEPTVATAAATTTAATATASSLSKPFVQVGTFGVEENANSAANKIRRNGLNAEVRELTSDGKSVWRVLVGPAATRSERNAIQRDVKDLGFSDAFTVKN
ncbi:SPOR domain-containing protein [Ruegeria arenilitoris]|uniref:SPOR domain-containing protein n=1 Tax=Ruegeria arenilitoris TaxID=1173585 RepID=UPI00147DDBCB|nr:SPOR domain-containing protein [Ruegeria arenilitoris]